MALGDADGTCEDMQPVYALLENFRLEDAEVLVCATLMLNFDEVLS